MTMSMVSFELLILFATKLGLIVHYHKPECFMEKLDCCVHGQGHRKISKCQWMFVQMIFSESQNILPNLVEWWSIMGQSVMQIFVVVVIFKVKITARAHMIKLWLFLLLFESLATKLGLMIHHRKPECPVNKMDYCI